MKINWTPWKRVIALWTVISLFIAWIVAAATSQSKWIFVGPIIGLCIIMVICLLAELTIRAWKGEL